MFNKSRFCSFSVLALITCFIISAASVSAYECGDINCSGGEPDISDITRLIDYLYISHDPLCDTLIADVNNSGGEPDISDITRLIDFLYISHNQLTCPTATYCPTTMSDIDGNIYQVVQIGDQCWMMENLKVTHYRNGDSIPNVTVLTDWKDLTTGAYCNYDNNPDNAATYGRLYNWFAVDDSRGLAPEGWHVPSDDEWKQLERYLGMDSTEADNQGWRGTDEGGKLKETGEAHWNSPNEGATNETGFTALPGGYLYPYLSAFFESIGKSAYFWSSTEDPTNEGWYRILDYAVSQIARYSYNKVHGYSVRCVKDSE